jgi:hypothetical protein
MYKIINMRQKAKLFLSLVIGFLFFTGLSAQLKYPITKKVTQSDDYFGTTVEDPYRWLEDDKSAETGEWVMSQNVGHTNLPRSTARP